MSSTAEREVLQGGRVKGGMLKSHMEWVRKHHGDEGVKRVIAALPPNIQHEVSSILASSWYPFASLVALDRAIEKTFPVAGGDTVRELGRYSSELNLTTTYRVFRRDDIHDFFGHSALLHSQFQDFGKVVYEQAGPTRGRMSHSDYVSFSPLFCRSALGYYEESIRLHGGKTPKVRETQCQCRGAKSCVFEMEWS
jgi:predicted hydrocarbon binding protein